MDESLTSFQADVLARIDACTDIESLTLIRNEVLSKKGTISRLMAKMGGLSADARPAYGKQVNDLKLRLEQAIHAKRSLLLKADLEKKLIAEKLDITRPASAVAKGTMHPLIRVQRQIEEIFRSMGYTVMEGSEVEEDLYNFERANIPQDHPAREMQDTFYISESLLLRTHTTAIQTRALEANAPQIPVKVICPGKTYRKDADDATHSHQFVQIEGLVVGEGVTFSDLKGTLELMARALFGGDRKVRFRPSYFQFTEPSAEVDVSCPFCDGQGCSVCKQSGWIEILGSGMVHPEVLKMAGYDPEQVRGFAFGLGVERVAMLKYGIDDIRLFYQNDLRFLTQFSQGGTN